MIDIEIDKMTYLKYQGVTYCEVSDGKVDRLKRLLEKKEISHGRYCMEAFHSVPNAKLDTFILLRANKDGQYSVYDLIAAFRWAIDNGINIISLSIGTVDYLEDTFVIGLDMKMFNYGEKAAALREDFVRLGYSCAIIDSNLARHDFHSLTFSYGEKEYVSYSEYSRTIIQLTEVDVLIVEPMFYVEAMDVIILCGNDSEQPYETVNETATYQWGPHVVKEIILDFE